MKERYDSIFRINERIGELRHELAGLYSAREKMFRKAVAEFTAIKEQMSGVK